MVPLYNIQGLTLWNCSIGILDYSTKETNDYGQTYLSQGDWAKRMDLDVSLLTSNLDAVQRQLALVRGKPVIFDGNNETDYIALKVYGFYRDFELILQNPVRSKATIRIEGLI